jgi:hypothetical protein
MYFTTSRADKNTGKARTYIQGRVKGLSDLHVALNVLPNQLDHPCANNNGGCSHICVAKGDRSSLEGFRAALVSIQFPFSQFEVAF